MCIIIIIIIKIIIKILFTLFMYVLHPAEKSVDKTLYTIVMLIRLGVLNVLLHNNIIKDKKDLKNIMNNLIEGTDSFKETSGRIEKYIVEYE